MLADDPGAAGELESAESWLARIGAEEQPVPQTLMRLVGVMPEELSIGPSHPTQIRQRSVRVWGGAIAASLIAVIAGYAVHDFLPANPALIAPSKSAHRKIAPNNPVATVQQNSAKTGKPVAAPTVTSPNAPIPMNIHAVTAADYPPESVGLQEQGTVKVRYLVQKDGKVGECQVQAGSGFPRLDDAACVLVKRWLFRPATVIGGSPVEWWLVASIVFQLK
jgi:TonB family protein